MAESYYGLGLGSLYGQKNPYERKVAIASKVAENAGFAKPLIYATMGADMASADQWDQDQQNTIRSTIAAHQDLETQKQNQEAATKAIELAIKAADTNPEVATTILQAEASRNPLLAAYKDVTFVGKTNGDWISVADGTGQPYMVSKTGLAWMSAHPDQATDEIKARYIVPFGKPKPETPEKAPTTRKVSQGTQEVDQEWDPSTQTWKEVGRGPKYKPGAEGGETPNEKGFNKLSTEYNTKLQNIEQGFSNGLFNAPERNRRVKDLVDQYDGRFRRYKDENGNPYNLKNSREYQDLTMLTSGKPAGQTAAPKTTGGKLTPLAGGGYRYTR